jgi:hypothetical protein
VCRSFKNFHSSVDWAYFLLKLIGEQRNLVRNSKEIEEYETCCILLTASTIEDLLDGFL